MIETFVNGKKVRYNPGRLFVGLDTSLTPKEIKKLMIEYGGVVESIDEPNVAEVVVPSEETLAIMEKLKSVKGVRFVELDN